MVDIMLSAERIRTAPVEIRRWIENEIAASLGLAHPAPKPVAHDRVVTCSNDELSQVLEMVQGMPPVVHVFFELGRSGARHLPGDVEMRELAEIAQHARLEGVPQVIACLKIINDACRNIRGDEHGLLCAVDEEERCYVTSATSQLIRDLWQSFVALTPQAPEHLSCAPPYAVDHAQANAGARPA